MLQSKAPVGFGFIDREFRIRYMNETLAASNGATSPRRSVERSEELAPEMWPELEVLYPPGSRRRAGHRPGRDRRSTDGRPRREAPVCHELLPGRRGRRDHRHRHRRCRHHGTKARRRGHEVPVRAPRGRRPGDRCSRHGQDRHLLEQGRGGDIRLVGGRGNRTSLRRAHPADEAPDHAK